MVSSLRFIGFCDSDDPWVALKRPPRRRRQDTSLNPVDRFRRFSVSKNYNFQTNCLPINSISLETFLSKLSDWTLQSVSSSILLLLHSLSFHYYDSHDLREAGRRTTTKIDVVVAYYDDHERSYKWQRLSSSKLSRILPVFLCGCSSNSFFAVAERQIVCCLAGSSSSA